MLQQTAAAIRLSRSSRLGARPPLLSLSFGLDASGDGAPMSEAGAIEIVKTYAAEWGVPWRRIIKTEKGRSWWFFSVEWYTFTIDTGDGEAVASDIGGTTPAYFYMPST